MKPPAATTLLDINVSEFLARLAAAEPAPGGGSAAALAGACAAGLVAMVAAVTLARVREPADRSTLTDIQAQAGRLQDRLARLVDEDTAAYGRLSAARRLPKEGAEERADRREALQGALYAAITVPIAAAECCLDLLQLARPAAAASSLLAVPDAAMAALLAHAALAGSVRNAIANLSALRDAAMREQMLAHANDLAAQGEVALAAALRAADGRA